MADIKSPKTPPAKRPKPARSSGSFSAGMLQRPASAVKTLTINPDVGTQWQTKATEFYVKVLQQVERLLQGISDEATARKASDAVKTLQLVTRTRNRMAPDQFSVKADALLALLQRMELQQPPILHPPPTKEKRKKELLSNGNHVGHLTPERIKHLGTHFQSTVQAGNLQRYDIRSAKLAAPELGKGQAIPLCLPNDIQWDSRRNKCTRLNVARSTLNLNPTAVEILKSISGPVCIVSIVGPCRSGKSYVLSRLISSGGETKCHFDLGHEFDPKTMGIWMWDQPFKVKLKDYGDEEVTMVLLDTEGIDAVNASDEGDSQIFTLSVLLSSLLIYNSMTVPRREDLNQMHFVANLSKSIQVQAGEFADGQGVSQLANSNPRFMWLLRDVILIPTDKDNKPCHIKDHLLQKVLVEDATDDETQNDIRRCLLSFFSSFDAETLPPPSVNAHVMQNIDNPIYQKDISPVFLQKLAYVKKRIYDNCYPKKGFKGGSVVSGFQLSHMVQLYVDALNSPGGIPVIGSTWQRVLEATYTEGVETAVKCYKKAMEGVFQKLPLETDDLLGCHRKGVDESLKVFKQATSLDSESNSEVYVAFLDKLMSHLAAYDDASGECVGGELAHYLEKNWDASKTACHSLMKKLKEHHLDPLIDNLSPSTDFKTIEKAFVTVVTEYKKASIGPCAEDVLKTFYAEQEVQRTQLESQLSQIKNYDAEAKARMKELEDEKLKFDQKEMEMKQKMEQSKRDQEAKLQLMSEKHARDAENLRKQNEKEIEEQEKRLKNMADANLEKMKSENAQEMSRIRSDFERQERSLRDSYNRTQNELASKQNEIYQLNHRINSHSCGGGGGGGCFIAGTKVKLSDGSELAIEKQSMGVKILAIGGETSTITDEYVDHTLKPQHKIFGFNDDAPFAALHHPFWTTEGWKCLDPDTAKDENPDVDFKLLQVGDIVFRAVQTDPLLYEPVKVRRLNFTTLTEPTKIYGLHLEGPPSYHANGYIVAANYPVLTKKRVRDGMKKLTEEERESLKSTLTSVKRELTTVLGSWAEDALLDMGLTEDRPLGHKCVEC